LLKRYSTDIADIPTLHKHVSQNERMLVILNYCLSQTLTGYLATKDIQ